MLQYWKRPVVCLLVMVLLTGCFTGCTPTDTPDATTEQTEPSVTDTTGFTEPSVVDTIMPTGNTIRPVEVEQLRMPGYDAGWVNRFAGEFGSFKMVGDPEELNTVVEALKRMGKEITVSGQYNQTFFEQYRLVLIPMQSGSGSVTYDASVGFDGERIIISVTAQMPGVGTADMADWLVLVPLDRNVFPENAQVELQANQSAGDTSGIQGTNK